MDYTRFPVGDLIARPGAHVETDVEIAVDLRTESVEAVGMATGTLRIDAAAGALVVRGDVGVPASIVCSRCLVDAETEVTADITVTFGDADDEDSWPITPDHRIDLATPVREELAMTIPTAPLCRETCLGLCAICGTDLNREPCSGHEDLSSSPFAALEGLFPPE